MTHAHYLSMIIIGSGSFIVGLLPSVFRCTRTYPLFLSLILCLGGGVLLSTSLVHMLTEVQAKLKFTAQLYFGAGFVILYAFDEITHYFLRGKHVRLEENDAVGRKRNAEKYNYGTAVTISESSRLLEAKENDNDSNVVANRKLESFQDRRMSFNSLLRYEVRENDTRDTPSDKFQKDQVRCHVEKGDQHTSNPVANTGLLIALSIHSILEGVSVGVQTEVSQILMLLGAVSSHKLVLSFCLGLELASNNYSTYNLLASIFVFSIGSPIGIFIGMFVTSPQGGLFNIEAQLQAIAAGSLFYVAAFEVLPRERFKWQSKPNEKAAGVLQFAFFVIGFLSIAALHLYINRDREGNQDNVENVVIAPTPTEIPK